MKKFVFFILMVCLAGLVTGCKGPGKKEDTPSATPPEKKVCFPITFNTEEDYPVKEFRLEEIADISFIPLETPKGQMLGNIKNTQTVFTENDIFLCDNSKIFRFDQTGRFLNTIGRMGHGPTEYTFLHDFCLDEGKQQVYVRAGFQRQMLVYDYQGNYLRKFSTYHVSYPIVFDSVSLLVVRDIMPYPGVFLNISPFERLSVVDGQVLDTFVAPHQENPVVKGTPIMYGSGKAINRFRDEYILTHLVEDTIYTLTRDKHLSLRYIKEPSNTSLGKNRWFYELGIETDRFAVINLLRMKSLKDLEVEYKYILIEKDGGNVYFPKLTISNYLTDKEDERVSLVLHMSGYPNVAVVPLNAYVLIEKLKQNKLEGRLKEIAAGLKDDSNPVLMVIRFRE